MELRKINTQDALAQWEYTTALPEDENGLTNPYHGVFYDDYVKTVLPKLISYEHPVDMPDWFVPETYYYLWDEDCLVGEFRIRHCLTDALRNGAGHIGYSIRNNMRGKGYGTAGLKLTLEIARGIIPEDEIYDSGVNNILCIHCSNILLALTANVRIDKRNYKKFW